ncbi:MAG: DUF418 domain-containing protein [Sphingopyxis sp.]|nr:DUF418 domain-containing protein [Sphingopyxis sp.]
MLAALPSPDRIAAIDVVRGIAVIGIVLMNIFAFAMPSAAYFNPLAYGGTDGLSMGVWTASFLLVEDKFRGLFAILFGASALLLLGSASQARHYVRMAWLFLFGLAHAILLASNDILRLYALCGLFLPLFAALSARRLWQGAALLMLLHLLAGGALFARWTAEVLSFTGPTAVTGALAYIERLFGAVPDMVERQRALMIGPYGDVIAWRISNWSGPLLTALAFLPVTLAQMLSGMALYRSGFFTGGWSLAQLRRCAMLGMALGLPPLVGLAAWAFANGFASIVVAGNALIWSAPFDLALSLAFAALAMLWLGRAGGTALAQRLAATGRMALSNYLATSVIFALIFYSFGLGQWGEYGRTALYCIAAVPMLAMLLWSRPWLTRYRYGPAEWLWRSLVERRAVALRGGVYDRA